jgi:ribosome-associated protein
VEESQSLNNKQKEKLKKIAGNRINNEWILRITNQEERTKERNIKNALENFKNLLTLTLKEEKERIPTKIPRSVNEKRIQMKKKQSQVKANRGKKNIESFE